MTTTERCPACGGDRLAETVRRERLPTMQNYVHRTREGALAAASGKLVLAVCRTCGFAWNCCFDPDRLVYDDNYDNAVPSRVMSDYYARIAGYLVERYLPSDDLVVDVGCGNGTFLRTLCELAPAARGLGIDPALPADSSANGDRVALVKGVFSAALVDEAPALVVSRHVLEHIPQPGGFLSLIFSAVAPFGGCPGFFEVPDLQWIVEHRTFWDFCYEHCNYFTAASFSRLLARAGFEPVRTQTAFGDQYLWLEVTATGNSGAALGGEAGDEIADRLLSYASDESARIAAARVFLQRQSADGSATVVWGMATKGVMFALLADPRASLVDVCVDANPNKQGCFVPLTAHPIEAPEVLRTLQRPLTILVMNENYLEEIERACADLSLDATFVTAAEAQTS